MSYTSFQIRLLGMKKRNKHERKLGQRCEIQEATVENGQFPAVRVGVRYASFCPIVATDKWSREQSGNTD